MHGSDDMGASNATNVVTPSSTLNGLDVAATKYCPQDLLVANRTQISLLFTHGVSLRTSSHRVCLTFCFCSLTIFIDKELWLPTIEHIFELQKHSPSELKFVIVEAWTVDLPNHGQSAIINHSRLVARPEGISEYSAHVQIRTCSTTTIHFQAHTNLPEPSKTSSLLTTSEQGSSWPLDTLQGLAYCECDRFASPSRYLLGTYHGEVRCQQSVARTTHFHTLA